MTGPTRADRSAGGPSGRSPAARPRAGAPNRPSGPRRDDDRVGARRAERRALPRPAADQPLTASWDPAARAPRRGRWAVPAGVSGWRVVALPVLVVLTLLAVYDAAGDPVNRRPVAVGPSAAPSGPSGPSSPAPSSATPLIPNPTGGPGFEEAKASAELPGGGPFTEAGAGTWTVVPGAGERFGAGEPVTYTVEVEDGVVVEGGAAGFAQTVRATLDNPKSWIGSGSYAFARTDDPAEADIRISLTSQATTRAVCGFVIPFDASCWSGPQGRVVINTARWARGAVAFQGNVVQYQQYVLNHEVGHGLGFSHTPCPATGELAPVMMQQTWGTSNDYLAALGTDRVQADGKVCEPNAWPFPTVG